MDYPYMPEKVREQGREAIEAELEKHERIRAVLEAISAGILIVTIVLGGLFAVHMLSRGVHYEYTLNGQTSVAESCKVSNGAFVCTLPDGTMVQADSFKKIVEKDK